MEPGGREWKTVEAVELSPYDFHKLLCNLSIAIYIGSSFFLLATKYDPTTIASSPKSSS
jgi:hypothetical protein